MRENAKKKILHITPHLGGGVGKVLLNYLSKAKEDNSFAHKVACLDYANENAVKTAENIGIPLIDNMFKKKQKLLEMIADSDITLIHWWNHPLLYDFLVRERLPKSRIIIWSHISGFYPPQVFTKKILQYPDLFVFTTPISRETRKVKNLSKIQKKSLRVIWSTSGVERTKLIKLKKHSGFNVGYIGTVDYAKMHPKFLNICARINIPDAKFIICGGSNEREIKKEAEKLNIAKKFTFTGPVLDIAEYLSIFDIFGYPLASYHYGTCDQSLQESMAAGVVPVVLKNQMEKYMVKNKVTGIVAKNENYYIKAVQILYKNKKLRNSLAQNAKKYAIKNFSLNKMAREWKIIFKEMLTIPKTVKKWAIAKKSNKIRPSDVFLESLDDYGKNFTLYLKNKTKGEEKIKKLAQSANWQSKTKGTTHHYNFFFPKDSYLLSWSQLMKKNNQ